MDRHEIERALTTAIQAQRAGRRDEAGRLYRALIERAGEQPVALNALGMIALSEGRPNIAADLFRRAIAADPHAPDLRMNLAKAVREQHDDVAERSALEGALAIDQRHFMALVRLAELLERTGDEAGAAERWAAVLTLAPMIEQRTPALEMMLDHAREQVARGHARFADAVEAAIAPALANLDAAAQRRFNACVDHALGRRAIFTNECTGLHFPFLPADEFLDRAHFSWLEQIEAKTDEIRKELLGLLAVDQTAFLPYIDMQPGTSENKWTSLNRSSDWSALHLWKDGARNEEACRRAPRTADAVEALPLSDLPGRTPTVFFSLLRPGTHLPSHTGVSNVRTIIHLPLVVPEGCSFRVGGETRQWEEGRAWAFDDTIEHEAWNRSDQVRGILIFDVWNPYLTLAERELLRLFYAVSDSSGHGAEQTIRVGD